MNRNIIVRLLTRFLVFIAKGSAFPGLCKESKRIVIIQLCFFVTIMMIKYAINVEKTMPYFLILGTVSDIKRKGFQNLLQDGEWYDPRLDSIAKKKGVLKLTQYLLGPILALDSKTISTSVIFTRFL